MLSFTGTSPLFNVITYVLLRSLGLDNYLEQLKYWVGVLLMFSGGTFLYVSTIHILPEVYMNAIKIDSHSKDEFQNQKGGASRKWETLILILGLFTPKVLHMLA